MNSVAIIYASKDGQTEKISLYLKNKITQLSNHTISVTCISVPNNEDSINKEQVKAAQLIIFGAPIRYGKHLSEVTQLISKQLKHNTNQQTGFFSVNLTARKPEKSTPQTSGYTQKLFKSLNWQPDFSAVFAGKLSYPSYRFFDKYMIRFIMWLTKGPTDLTTVKEFTQWEKVDEFAASIVNEVNATNKTT